MPKKPDTSIDLKFEPVTPDRWNDVERLFGERGACAGCWCMCWRLPSKEWNAGKGEKNKRAIRKIIISGEVPGLLAYDGKVPIGWCSVAPREKFLYLAKSKSLSPIDDKPVWSITCLFIDKRYRKQGVGVALLKAAVKFVYEQGGKIVEGYPSVTDKDLPAPWVWTGVLPAYLHAGFTVVKRPSKSRAMVRKKA